MGVPARERTGVIMLKRATAVLVIVAAATAGAYAQRNRGGQQNIQYDPGSQRAKYDGRWAFVRLRYTSGFGRGGPAWAHDYPIGEQHFLQIVKFVTNADVREDTTQILTLDDPEIFKYPIVYMAEPGYWTVNEKEASNFRAYLQKGGMVIFDDFHYQDWPYFEQSMKQVLPDAKFMDLDIANPLFHSFFDVPSFDVVHNMYDQGRPIFRGIYEDNDPKKRLLAIINYNTDISEYWEYSATGFNPVSDTNQAYQIGVNWIIYGFTH
ncbi:MAG: DUF4159 domain-containing protein [Acidobacteria bacterium]|nr:MAG: DUF4159 domain-containing protein [Acidobacteriota bacterium]